MLVPTERFKPRETDAPWQQFFAAIIRAPNVAVAVLKMALALGLGGALAVGVYRFTAIDQIQAMEVRHTLIFKEVTDSLSAQRRRIEALQREVVGLRADASTLVRAECRRTSKAWQDALAMTCSPNLYLGAPIESR